LAEKGKEGKLLKKRLINLDANKEGSEFEENRENIPNGMRVPWEPQLIGKKGTTFWRPILRLLHSGKEGRKLKDMEIKWCEPAFGRGKEHDFSTNSRMTLLL